MDKVCIVYTSMTGNTEAIKELLEKTLSSAVVVDTYILEHADMEIIVDYKYILIGSYTYFDGELPYEAEDFYEQLADYDLTGKYVACFGSGDSCYPQFCEALVIFEERIKERGGEIMEPALKIELSPDDQEQHKMCIDFAGEIINFITSVRQGVFKDTVVENSIFS